MTIEELIEELRKLPPESEVTEVSGWSDPVYNNGRETFFSRGVIVRILLPQKRVKGKPDLTP